MPASDSLGPTAPAAILGLGNPLLRRPCAVVGRFTDSSIAAGLGRLHATLDDFRRRRGFGRAIAAAQIGLPWRILALHLEGQRLSIFNPEIVWRSEESFTLWDDCLSFPDLLVRVRRRQSIRVRWQDEHGRWSERGRWDRSHSELLQHEIDHLDGILAVDRALDKDSLVLRPEFEANEAFYRAQADATAWDGS